MTNTQTYHSNGPTCSARHLCISTAGTVDFLTNRTQYLRLKEYVSSVVLCSAGGPRGTVLFLLLFTLYTSDFTHYTVNCHLQMFSDDTAIVGCVSEGEKQEYRGGSSMTLLLVWMQHLNINISKPKEMVINFERKIPQITPVNIQGLDIELWQNTNTLVFTLRINWTN